jgi:hypothetical protein
VVQCSTCFHTAQKMYTPWWPVRRNSHCEQLNPHHWQCMQALPTLEHTLHLPKSCIKVIKGVQTNCTDFSGYILHILSILKSSSFRNDFHISNSKTMAGIRLANNHHAKMSFPLPVTLRSFCSSIWPNGRNFTQTFPFPKIFVNNPTNCIPVNVQLILHQF